MPTAQIDGRKIHFSDGQYRLFMTLWNARGGRLTMENIADGIWGHCKSPDDTRGVVMTHAHYVRRKLIGTRFDIHTIRRYGYRLIRLPGDFGHAMVDEIARHEHRGQI